MLGRPCLHDQGMMQNGDSSLPIYTTVKVKGKLEPTLTKPQKDTMKNMKKTICSICEKDALMHCVDCKNYLCKQCRKCHDSFTNGHKLVTVSALQSRQVTGHVTDEGLQHVTDEGSQSGHAADEGLQSGHVTDEGRFCELHPEQVVRYYCETEEKQVCVDCISLKTCPCDHVHTPLKEAAEKQLSSIEDLMSKCITGTRVKFQEALEEAEVVLANLIEQKKQTIELLDKIGMDYIQMIKSVIKKHKDEVCKLKHERVKEIHEKLKELQLNVDVMDMAFNQGSEVINSRSIHLITYRSSILTKTLSSFVDAVPPRVSKDLSFIKFEANPISAPFIGHLLHAEWKLKDRFHTKGLHKPTGVAINRDGHVVIGSWKMGSKVYTKQGEAKLDLCNTNAAPDLVITPDDRYAIIPRHKGVIEFYNQKGTLLTTSSHMTCTNNKPSNINSIAVDKQGKIIVGLVSNTVSTHHADGSLICKFATKYMPFRLAITSQNKIVCSFYDSKVKRCTSLQLMDYTGCYARAILPPANIRNWDPGCVCCGAEEIFVANEKLGDPAGIYRYTSDGNYLGCCTTQVTDPRGIEMSCDGTELFVAERRSNQVKVFHR
ncbi:uncharacterized protein [Amphiura filiformis]|uniref:uncharacterized protein n=1 Tax=Amphiura filiformis TaxID=82378 RepID=UPI003B2215CB